MLKIRMKKYLLIIMMLLAVVNGYFCVYQCNDFPEGNTDSLCFCCETKVSIIKNTSFPLPLKICQILPQEQQTILKDLIVSIFHPPR